MFEIKGNDLFLTRGDSARIEISIINACTGSEYTPVSSDIFRFTVKKNVYSKALIFQKRQVGYPAFAILPSDTKELDFATYVYDVELTTESGDVYTIVPYANLHILKEVTT